LATAGTAPTIQTNLFHHSPEEKLRNSIQTNIIPSCSDDEDVIMRHALFNRSLSSQLREDSLQKCISRSPLSEVMLKQFNEIAESLRLEQWCR
jgi:hypothetical protein